VGLAKGREQQVAGLLSQNERAPHHRGCGLDRTGPGQDVVSDNIVDLAAKTRGFVLLSKRNTQMAKSEAVAVVAEANRMAQLGERQR
jgi:hypothetical protein